MPCLSKKSNAHKHEMTGRNFLCEFVNIGFPLIRWSTLHSHATKRHRFQQLNEFRTRLGFPNFYFLSTTKRSKNSHRSKRMKSKRSGPSGSRSYKKETGAPKKEF